MSVVNAFIYTIIAALMPLISLAKEDKAILPEISKGKLDISEYFISDFGTIDLNGEWEFYYDQLLSPEDFRKGNHGRPDFIDIPSIWNGQYLNGLYIDGQGFATYHLTIKKENKAELLALSIPTVYSSYKLWVNGKLLAHNGTVGKCEVESIPQWKPLVKVFRATGQAIEIVWQVSNFHHHRGGIHKTLKLGDTEHILQGRESTVIASTLLVGGLFILGAFFIIFFLLRKGQLSTLYFGLICLFWALRSLFSNVYLITSISDFSWNAAIRIEYISLYATMLVCVLFITNIYTDAVRSIVKYIVIFINHLFIILTLILPPLYFTTLMPAYQFFVAVNLLYIVVLVIRALIRNQQEAWYSAVGIILGISLFGYELGAYVMVIKTNAIYLSLGYLTIFFLNSLVLASHFVNAYHKISSLEEENESSAQRLREA